MRPDFADPKTDFVFHRLFGTEEHKELLLALLNALLELDPAHRIVEVELLSPEQRPSVNELKFSIVDVKCDDAQGIRCVVEMQVLNVEGFENRVMYNAAKAYATQLSAGLYGLFPNVIPSLFYGWQRQLFENGGAAF
ncbi:MAG: Rpn family recombination-promoting nuclease/putative transposase, partial [Polyangiaceae bacterium]|nr:Rpn family recombination-promoting nuclease/putative transposase [Polyangiaceae bacterium]